MRYDKEDGNQRVGFSCSLVFFIAMELLYCWLGLAKLLTSWLCSFCIFDMVC